MRRQSNSIIFHRTGYPRRITDTACCLIVRLAEELERATWSDFGINSSHSQALESFVGFYFESYWCDPFYNLLNHGDDLTLSCRALTNPEHSKAVLASFLGAILKNSDLFVDLDYARNHDFVQLRHAMFTNLPLLLCDGISSIRGEMPRDDRSNWQSTPLGTSVSAWSCMLDQFVEKVTYNLPHDHMQLCESMRNGFERYMETLLPWVSAT